MQNTTSTTLGLTVSLSIASAAGVACHQPVVTTPVLVEPSSATAGQVETQFVDLEQIIPDLVFDLRYATTNNFTGIAVYPVAKAYLQADAARALFEAQRELQQQGLGLLIYDAYRPLHVQQQMWDLIRDERYVSNPAVNRGRHTRGTAVDLTIIDAQGQPLPMPTDFDDFSEKAHRDYSGASEIEKANRALLRTTMEKYGFEPLEFEWWHFDYKGWQEYPAFDIALDELERRHLMAKGSATAVHTSK